MNSERDLPNVLAARAIKARISSRMRKLTQYVGCRALLAEKILMPLKQILERIEQQAFAKTPRAAQKIARALLNQINDKASFVHIVIAIKLANFAKSLNANGQLAPNQQWGWGERWRPSRYSRRGRQMAEAGG